MPAGNRSGKSRFGSNGLLTVVCCAITGTALSSSHAAGPVIDAAAVKGAASCAKCHPAEHTAWTKSTHFRTHERISSSAGQKYAKKYGGQAICVTCHSTPHAPSAQPSAAVGVSCESCHMPAGGSNGWLDLHSDYGGEGIKRETESAAHLRTRLDSCEKAGMARSSNPYLLVRNCYTCHIVADEKLLDAGHKPGHGDFELTTWIQGEVRHNFQVDQKTNAPSSSLLKARHGIEARQRQLVMLVLGKIVELEVCLRNLAAIDAVNLKKRYAGRRGWAGRAKDAYEYLNEEVAPKVDSPHINAAVEAINGLTLGRRFKDQKAAAAAADKLQSAAKQLSDEQADVDLAGLYQLVEELGKPRGKVYQP